MVVREVGVSATLWVASGKRARLRGDVREETVSQRSRRLWAGLKFVDRDDVISTKDGVASYMLTLNFQFMVDTTEPMQTENVGVGD